MWKFISWNTQNIKYWSLVVSMNEVVCHISGKWDYMQPLGCTFVYLVNYQCALMLSLSFSWLLVVGETIGWQLIFMLHLQHIEKERIAWKSRFKLILEILLYSFTIVASDCKYLQKMWDWRNLESINCKCQIL